MIGKRKPLQELTLMDDYMFYAVMEDAELLKELLIRVLGIGIDSLKYAERQKDKKKAYEAKGIRLDILFLSEPM